MDITRGEIIDAISWVTECLGRRTRVSADVAIRYVIREYEGGWEAFVTEMRGCF